VLTSTSLCYGMLSGARCAMLARTYFRIATAIQEIAAEASEALPASCCGHIRSKRSASIPPNQEMCVGAHATRLLALTWWRPRERRRDYSSRVCKIAADKPPVGNAATRRLLPQGPFPRGPSGRRRGPCVTPPICRGRNRGGDPHRHRQAAAPLLPASPSAHPLLRTAGHEEDRGFAVARIAAMLRRYDS
jgi:hypothetical protein